MGWRRKLAARVAKFVLSHELVLRYVVDDERTRMLIANDPVWSHGYARAMPAIAPYLKDKPERPGQQTSLEWFKHDAVAAALDSNVLLKELTDRLSTKTITLEFILSIAPLESWIDYLTELATADPGVMEQVVVRMPLHESQPRAVVQMILDIRRGKPAHQAFLEHLFDEKFLALLLQNDDITKKIIGDERTLRQILLDRKLRERLPILKAQEMAGALSYPFPAVVCSYPRSGSNFLQSILLQSSGMNNPSIYGRKNLFKPSELTLTVKSHAPSPSYLFQEYRRKVEWPERPHRVVLLQRDPRDVMVSFYEYTQFNRKTSISQSEFLHGVDYFYASTIDPDAERTEYLAGLTVAEAYREHVRKWFAERSADLSCLVVRYEDLIADPDGTFSEIFSYLEIKCPLAREFLNVKVSQYNDSNRSRGVAGGWRATCDQYETLLHDINNSFAEEIAVLGYPRD